MRIVKFEISINQHEDGNRAIHGSIHQIDEATGEVAKTFTMAEFPLTGMSAAERVGAWDSFIRQAMNDLYWRISDTRQQQMLDDGKEAPPLREQIKSIWSGEDSDKTA